MVTYRIMKIASHFLKNSRVCAIYHGGPRSVREKENKNCKRYWDIPGIRGEY